MNSHRSETLQGAKLEKSLRLSTNPEEIGDKLISKAKVTKFKEGSLSFNFSSKVTTPSTNPRIKDFEYLLDYKSEPKLLGEGSFGKVVLAKNKFTNVKYAIKIANKKEIINKVGSLTGIYKEAKLHTSLKHPKIVECLGFDEDNTSIYMIMEYVKGYNLFEKIRKEGQLNEKASLNVLVQLLSAVIFLHEHGIVHRDIKPENILVNQFGEIKLCDFGWATEISLANRQTFCGTFEYMAPEIVSNESYSQSVDVWSLGVLLFEMLHCYSPFNQQGNAKQTSIIQNILAEEVKIDSDVKCSEQTKKLLKGNTLIRNDS